MRLSLEDAGTAVFLALGILLLVLGPTMIGLFELLTLTKYLILSLFAMSLAYIWGFGGIISFGQSAFFGLGGYAFGVAGLNMIGDTTTPLLLSVGISAAFAAALGYFMFFGRLTEVYMGIVTLVVTLILFKLIGHTAGSEYAIGVARLGGFNGMPSLPILVDPFTGEEMWPETMFQVVLGLLLAVYLMLKLIQKSRFGRVCLAIANNETRASLLGYDVRLHKVAMFAIGGGIAGLAGGLYASNETFIDPNALTLIMSAQCLVWVMVGGVGTYIGPILACCALNYLAVWLGGVDWGLGSFELENQFIVGTILLIIVLALPKGLVPTIRDRIFPHWPHLRGPEARASGGAPPAEPGAAKPLERSA
ncbi:MAG: branched-chain amino acid ABC transporter permease [Sneathiellaceae bacterium]